MVITWLAPPLLILSFSAIRAVSHLNTVECSDDDAGRLASTGQLQWQQADVGLEFGTSSDSVCPGFDVRSPPLMIDSGRRFLVSTAESVFSG